MSAPAIQTALFSPVSILNLAPPIDGGDHGEIFTRRWIVDLILDLIGYTPDRDLGRMVAIEPSCGSGAFLVPMISRLCESLRLHGRSLEDAAGAIRAFDLLERNADAARANAVDELATAGYPDPLVSAAVDSWVTVSDFLLTDHQAESADFVIGNPPYVRLEDVADDRVAAYRSTCKTMGGRADIFVGFFEIGLQCLRHGGTLGFICADRWQRNQYGARLREMIGTSYSMVASIEMHDVDAFEEQVSAYPAITVIKRDRQGEAVVATTTRDFDEAASRVLRGWWHGEGTEPLSTSGLRAARLPHWFQGQESWPAGSPARLALLEDLNERFPLLEDMSTRTRIGIGVATGADGIFVTKDPEAVERERLLPLAMSRDTVSGHLSWSGHYLVNPWGPTGELVTLDDYPRLRAYLEGNASDILRRHVSKRAPHAWYRTIDKVEYGLTAKTKLLFPDMKMTTHPVLDPGGLYPHHNLYFVVSDGWDLEVLGGLLLSRVAEFFVDSYAVKMRGGTLRFQAQYLRRIRVPRVAEIACSDSEELRAAFLSRDSEKATSVALRLYGIAGIPD